jgi:hypothetical protein
MRIPSRNRARRREKTGARKTNVIERQDLETRFIEIGLEASRHWNLHFPGRETEPAGRTTAYITESGNLRRVPDGFEKSASLSGGSSVFY